MERVTLTPAYGRDYRSRTAAVESFTTGQDWILEVRPSHPLSRWDKKPTSVEQLRDSGVLQVSLRYDRQRKVTTITIPKEAF